MKMLLPIFYHFFLLGCTSFGGPAAHIGYFRRHFVEHLGWVKPERFANMVALSQLLPGPGSSQVGFAIGLERAGWLGAIFAFVGFTLPSLLIMTMLAYTATSATEISGSVIVGLKLFAVVIVADAVISMAKQFCTSLTLRLIAAFSAVFLFVLPSLTSQLLVLLSAVAVGVILPLSSVPASSERVASSFPWLPLVIFTALFVAAFTFLSESVFAPFYLAGSLVFGGGHVVLPLLQANLPQLDNDLFLTGYAAAQAIPGPMFTLATYLGALWDSTPNWINALIATLAVFAPGLLLMGAFFNHWQTLQAIPRFAHISAAINAAVVGILFAAWLNPIIPSAVVTTLDWLIVLIGYVVLVKFRPPVWVLLITFAGFGVFFG